MSYSLMRLSFHIEALAHNCSLRRATESIKKLHGVAIVSAIVPVFHRRSFKTSSTLSGCFAITASNTRAGASGRTRPCSQLRSVAGGSRTSRRTASGSAHLTTQPQMSTSGMCTYLTRTGTSSPFDQTPRPLPISWCMR
jgi:hypothetical protein